MELDQIVAHPLFPFADFRTNDASFLLLELYWAAVAQRALGPAAAQVVPLMAADRDPEGWGDPVMLDVWMPDRRRGAKVLLAENPAGRPACREAADKFACFPSIIVYTQARGIEGPDDEIDQICFCADMSEVARGVVLQLLDAFLLRGVPVEGIEPWFDDFCRRTGEGPTREAKAARYAAIEAADD